MGFQSFGLVEAFAIKDSCYRQITKKSMISYRASPPYFRYSPSFPDRWSKAPRLGADCVVVLSQQIRTTELTI